MVNKPIDMQAALPETEVSITVQATQAVREAFEQTKDAGLPVVVAEGNDLVEIQPDGSKRFLSNLPPKQKPARRSLLIR